MKLLVVIIIGQLVNLCAFGQEDQILESDSLRIEDMKKSLPMLAGKKRVDCLNTIGREYYYITWNIGVFRSDSIEKYHKIALMESMKCDYKYGESIALLGIALRSLSKDTLLAKKNIQQSLAIAINLGNNNLLGEVFYGFYIYYYYRNPALRSEYLRRSFNHFTLAGNNTGIAYTGMEYSEELVYRKQFEEALEIYEKSLAAAKNWGDFYTSYGYLVIEGIFLGIADIHELAGDYATALDWMKVALPYGEKAKLEWRMYNNMGELYRKIGKYDSAFYYYNLYAKADPGNEYNEMLRAKANLQTGNQKKALDSLKAIKSRNKGIYWTFEMDISLARAYAENDQNWSALKHARTWAQSIAVLRNNPDEFLLELWDVYALIFKNLGKYDSACYYQEKYIRMKDSYTNKQMLWRINNKLFSQRKDFEDREKLAQISLLKKDVLLKEQLLKEQTLLKLQRETQLSLLDKDNQLSHQKLIQEKLLKDQKVAQIALLDRDNKLLDKNNQLKDQRIAQQRVSRNVMIGGLFALLLSGAFIVYNLSLKRKNEKLNREQVEKDMMLHKLEAEKAKAILQQQASELEMQALRAQMNPHFIFNSLNSINSFIVKHQPEPASDYLTRFARLIRMVLVNSEKSTISLDEELIMLRLYLDMEKLRSHNAFEYSIEIDKQIENENIMVPPLLFQPFCENAIWHGLMPKQGMGELKIMITRKDDQILCLISDNGIGREKSGQLKNNSSLNYTSMGVKLTNSRLALFNKSGLMNAIEMHDHDDGIPGMTVVLKLNKNEAVL